MKNYVFYILTYKYIKNVKTEKMYFMLLYTYKNHVLTNTLKLNKI